MGKQRGSCLPCWWLLPQSRKATQQHRPVGSSRGLAIRPRRGFFEDREEDGQEKTEIQMAKHTDRRARWGASPAPVFFGFTFETGRSYSHRIFGAVNQYTLSITMKISRSQSYVTSKVRSDGSFELPLASDL